MFVYVIFMKIVKKQRNYAVVLLKHCLIKAHKFLQYLFALSAKNLILKAQGQISDFLEFGLSLW